MTVVGVVITLDGFLVVTGVCVVLTMDSFLVVTGVGVVITMDSFLVVTVVGVVVRGQPLCCDLLCLWKYTGVVAASDTNLN